MSADDDDIVWRALSDPTRRAILDHLKGGPKTTGGLSELFELSRFGVMKHLSVLEKAGLILVRRRGRERYNFLNPAPIRQIYERWMQPVAEAPAISMLRLKEFVEKG